jgi:uncharacterized protein YbaR (Trm112 family)
MSETKQQAASETSAIDPKMLGVLVCPKSGGPLTYDSDTKELISKKGKLAFPIREGVPIMLIDEARPL